MNSMYTQIGPSSSCSVWIFDPNAAIGLGWCSRVFLSNAIQYGQRHEPSRHSIVASHLTMSVTSIFTRFFDPNNLCFFLSLQFRAAQTDAGCDCFPGDMLLVSREFLTIFHHISGSRLNWTPLAIFAGWLRNWLNSHAFIVWVMYFIRYPRS